MGLTNEQWDSLIPKLADAAASPYERANREKLQRMDADAKLAQLIKGAELEQQGIDANVERARSEAERTGMKPGKYSIRASTQSFEVDPEREDMLRYLQMRAMMDQRDEEAVRKLEKRSFDAGTSQAVPALQRGEEAIPGIFTKPDEQVKLKSVGGIKNLAPNFSVPLFERMGWMPKGAGQERTALQELMNTKLYDASGKAINENEMKRISDAMGLRGIFDPQEITSALRQMGYTVLEKQKGVTAGAPSRIVNRFESAGGLAGKETLADLIGATAKSKNEMVKQGAPQGSGIDVNAIKAERDRRARLRGR